MASRFGEMLLNRRRELGMSIQQVANVIKIRPQIIEFFETGNFASMPPRGYAQGMIASYARYLGLNPREVVNAYFDELYVYERGGSAAGSQFTEGATNPVPRSASMSGRYLMVDTPPAPNSRYAQRPPQAGYVSDSTSGHVPLRVADNQRRAANLPAGDAYGRDLGGSGYDRGGYGAPEPGGAPDRTVRMNRPQDLSRTTNMGRQAGPYQRGGAPRSGQLAQRSGGPSRPGYRGSGNRGGGGGRPPRRGSSPQGGGLLNDSRVIIGGLIAIVVLLILVIFLLVRSCTATPAATDPATAETPATTATTDTGEEDDATGDDSTDTPATDGDTQDADTSDAGTADTAASPQTPAEPVETNVTVAIPEGVTSWLEIYVDGVSVYAAQTAGPFEQSYTPESSIEITVDHPGDVEITKNGESVDWDTRTSGVGKVTINVPQPETPATTDAEGSTDGESSDGTSTTDDSAAAAA